MVSSIISTKYFVRLALILSSINLANAGQLDDFSSDGCSLFPDGNFSQQNLWCDCCIIHDIAYWQGGSRQQKIQADLALQDCVLKKTGSNLLADTMYYGVSAGGSPVFPTWYRWGYGWRYGRGFRSLNRYENQLKEEKLQHYRLSMPESSCDFDHPVQIMIKKEIQELLKPN